MPTISIKQTFYLYIMIIEGIFQRRVEPWGIRGICPWRIKSWGVFVSSKQEGSSISRQNLNDNLEPLISPQAILSSTWFLSYYSISKSSSFVLAL